MTEKNDLFNPEKDRMRRQAEQVGRRETTPLWVEQSLETATAKYLKERLGGIERVGS